MNVDSYFRYSAPKHHTSPLEANFYMLMTKPHPPIIELAVVRLSLENDHLDWHKRFTSSNVAIQGERTSSFVQGDHLIVTIKCSMALIFNNKWT